MNRGILSRSRAEATAGVSAENVLFKQSPRNQRLAEALARCGLVERSGQGADRMFAAAIRGGKLPPDCSESDENQVGVVLHGTVQDEAFIAFLDRLAEEKQRAFRVRDLFVLDAVHRSRHRAAPCFRDAGHGRTSAGPPRSADLPGCGGF